MALLLLLSRLPVATRTAAAVVEVCFFCLIFFSSSFFYPVLSRRTCGGASRLAPRRWSEGGADRRHCR